MKEKFIKIIESTRTIILVTFLLAVGIGFWVYKNVGYAPKNEIDNQIGNNISSGNNSGENMDLAFPKTGRVNAVFVKPGDSVKKGEVLANLEFKDAEGALEIAKANYQKIINGATGADIDVAKAAVQTAQVNLDTVTAQQNLAVESAYRNLLNSTPEVDSNVGTGATSYVAPIVSGNYALDKEGDINITMYYTGNGPNFLASGILDNIAGIASSTVPQPIGNSGLYIEFPSLVDMGVSNWVISIPNKKAPDYIPNYNAYQSALQNQKSLIAVAQAGLDQANSALLLKVSSARPEDVAAATGALQVAQSAYDNDFIYAPEDGVVTVVNLGVGEIALANQRAISITVKTSN